MLSSISIRIVIAVETYIEKQHGLGEYPALLVVRVKLGGSTLTDWYIDTVGKNHSD